MQNFTVLTSRERELVKGGVDYYVQKMAAEFLVSPTGMCHLH
jgi:hypothetical protein